MANKSIKKIEVDKRTFLHVLKCRNCSIRNLGEEYDLIQRTERQIRRYLDDGKMPADVLDSIARYLNVAPKYLSGELHKQAHLYDDEIIRELAIASLSIENHPYPLESSSLSRYPEIFEGMINLYDISILDFKRLSPQKRVLFRQELDLAILNVISHYFTKNSKGENVQDELLLYESFVNDIDPFSYYAQLEGIGLTEKDLKEN